MTTTKRPSDMTLFDVIRIVGEALEPARRRQEAEQARRESLSPTAREAEDRHRAAAAQRAHHDEIDRKYARLKSGIVHRESWTLEQFAWLLLAEPPDDRDAWLPNRTDLQQRRIREVLESCVPHRLSPVNPTAPPGEWRFTLAHLLEISAEKDLGYYYALARALGLATNSHRETSPIPPAAPSVSAPLAGRTHMAIGAGPDPAPTAPCASTQEPQTRQTGLAAAGTLSREKAKRERLAAVEAFARAWVQESKQNGVEIDGRVHLAKSGKEFHRAFCARHPRWRHIGKKTIDADRRAKGIEVPDGRPRLRTPESSHE